MIINNELVNKLIRLGESDATFSLHPRIEDIVYTDGRFKQAGQRIPLLDAIRALLVRASHLFPGVIHPTAESGLSVSRDMWEALVISLERIKPMDDECIKGVPHKVTAEVANAKDSYKTVLAVMDALEKNPRLSMDEFVTIMSGSPNMGLSGGILCQAGDGNSGWITAEGILPPLNTPFPHTLTPEGDIEIQGYIREVDDSNAEAHVEVSGYRNAQTEKLLQHQPSRVPMSFDDQSIERDDLVMLQYHQQPVWFRVSAVCAVAAKYSRKTTFSLTRIMMAREALDQLHNRARQEGLPF